MAGTMRKGEPVDVTGLEFAIVAARFNEHITTKLVKGALEAFVEHGVPADVPVHWVPGAFELPLVCREIAASGLVHAVVALGCVIRGGTLHFEIVAGECARGIMAAGLETGVPIAFGVLTTDTQAQADERAGDGRDNKGREAAGAAIEMAVLFRRLGRQPAGATSARRFGFAGGGDE